MWSSVAPVDAENPAPSARSKHSATLIGNQVYVLGGRNGNLPMKDFWKYTLVTGKWQQLKPNGEKLPNLQEHTAVCYKDCIYVFGGEVSFSAGSETPLWVYEIKSNSWRKVRTRKGAMTPKGRRGHSALIHKGNMLIYGGYQDLRGSCGELWAFHFETESWHLLSGSSSKNTPNEFCPPPRHKHSAVLYDEAMWIYGGMTDLQERSDLWKWDLISGTWTNVKNKINPGPLHSHAACRLPSSMVLFGGEHDGHPTNDLWKFHFATETWERIVISGLKPQPRAETVALTVSELLLKEGPPADETAQRVRTRTCNSADRTTTRHSSYLPSNRVSPCERTYVFKASQGNYVDGSDQQEGGKPTTTGFLQEITKLSHLNLNRLQNKCSYSVLTGTKTDSTESLLRQYASPQGVENEISDDNESTGTPTRRTLVKSKSAYAFKRRDIKDVSPEGVRLKDPNKPQRHVEFASCTKKITREPISVPNFSLMTLPTPVLTPVEAARLVFLDTDEENDSDEVFLPPVINNVTQVAAKDCTIYENFKVVKRGESYSSHLAYADNPLYQHIVNGSSKKSPEVREENENVSSTSDYASIETMNRLSSASSFSAKVTPQEELYKTNTNNEGPFGFCNPNYLGPDIKGMVSDDTAGKKHFSNLVNSDVLEQNKENNCRSNRDDSLELQNYTGKIDRNTRVVFRSSSARVVPPKSLPLETKHCCRSGKEAKHRASSASRVEKNVTVEDYKKTEEQTGCSFQEFVPVYLFIVGGKEQGQVTVFKRPLSIWKLKLF